jgi:hypothetical protein
MLRVAVFYERSQPKETYPTVTREGKTTSITIALGIKLAAIMLVFAGITTAAFASPGIRTSMHLATSRQQEGFTELYFTTPGTLPKHFVPNQVHNIPFTIHNLEGRTTTYPYAVYLNDIQIGSQHSVTLANQDMISLPETIPISSQEARVNITIKLLNTNQSIHHWTEKDNSGAPQ